MPGTYYLNLILDIIASTFLCTEVPHAALLPVMTDSGRSDVSLNRGRSPQVRASYTCENDSRSEASPHQQVERYYELTGIARP